MLELRAYCALSASLRCRPATRVAPIGSSDAVWNFLPVATWFCVFASLTWFSRMALDAAAVHARGGDAHGLSPHRVDAASSNIWLAMANDLRRGLVGLLVAQHVGGLLVEVDAGHRIARGDVALVDGALARRGSSARRGVCSPRLPVSRFRRRRTPTPCRLRARRPCMASASAKALRLSPTAPALLRTVKVSPVAGAPLICTRQPLTSMLPPAV